MKAMMDNINYVYFDFVGLDILSVSYAHTAPNSKNIIFWQKLNKSDYKWFAPNVNLGNYLEVKIPEYRKTNETFGIMVEYLTNVNASAFNWLTAS